MNGPSARRIVLALLLSLLLHVALMWLPDMRLPRNDIQLPPLTARLEPLPKPATPPAPRRSRPAPHKQPAPEPIPIAQEAAEEHDAAVPEPASSTEADPAVDAASSVETATAVAPETVEEKPAHPLPKHARLSFLVYQGTGGFQIGEVRNELDIDDDGYVLKSMTQTVGLAKLFKTYRLTQTSRGRADAHGLHPDSYEEEKNNSGEIQQAKADFDWAAQMLRLSNGNEIALPAGAQDLLSIFYNLSQLPLDGDSVTLFVSNGRKLERYELDIGPPEELDTPMGKVHALHLSKRRAPGENGFEIWLGLEYRLFPVKYILLDASGEMIGRVLVSDIRVSDE